MTLFLPTTRDEMDVRGWDAPDIVLVCGDAWIDHPSFAAGLLGRRLESAGFKFAILPQPETTPRRSCLLHEPRRYAC